MVSPQGVYWLLTIPQEQYTPYLPDACAYVKGQLEQGGETGYLHWQLLVVFKRSVRLRAVRSTFGLFMENSADLQQPTSTSGRRTPQLQGQDSSWDANLLSGTPRPTGNQSLTWPDERNLSRSLRMFKFVISGSYNELLLIMLNLEPLSDNVTFTGAALDWGSPIVLGQRLGWTLTLSSVYQVLGRLPRP